MNPVKGDFVAIANLLEVVKRVPTNGLDAKIKGLEGSSGSASIGQYL